MKKILFTVLISGSLGILNSSIFAVEVGLYNESGQDVCIIYTTNAKDPDDWMNPWRGNVAWTGAAQKVNNSGNLWMKHGGAWVTNVQVYSVDASGNCSGTRIDHGGNNTVMFWGGGPNESFPNGLPLLDTNWVNYRYYLRKK